MKNIIILLILFCYSCKSKDCKTLNYKLIDEFESKLDVIKRMENGKKTRIVDYRDALLYLVNTTGIMTKADYSSTIGYSNKADYNDDMKLWKKWLKDNRCLTQN